MDPKPPSTTSRKALSELPILIETNIPGGNAIIESFKGDIVKLRPDPRDSAGVGFYWSIRVRNAANKSLTFVFSKQTPVGMHGPAVSMDEGATWQWMGNPDGSMDSFRCAFPQKAPSVCLSVGITYTLQHWLRFCGKLSWFGSFVRERILCYSRKGRPVPRLHVGRSDGKARYRIVLTARHHACEPVPNYVLEGLVLAALAEDETGAWFQKNVELLVLPFMDLDGVEDGAQGKGRQPHAPSRDYGDNNIYPETRALREFVARWSERRLAFMADLHSPMLRGDIHEQIYQVARPDPVVLAEQRSFGEILARVARGPLPVKNVDCPFFGDEWGLDANQITGVCPVDWFARMPGMRLATAFEIPYVNCSGKHMTADGARALGGDLANGIRQYLNAVTGTQEGEVPLARIHVDSAEQSQPHAPKPPSATAEILALEKKSTKPVSPFAAHSLIPSRSPRKKRSGANIQKSWW